MAVSSALSLRLQVLLNSPNPWAELIALLDEITPGGGGSPYGGGRLGVVAQPSSAAFVGGDYTTFLLPAGNTVSPPAPDSVIIIRATEAIIIDGTIDVSGTTGFGGFTEFARSIRQAGPGGDNYVGTSVLIGSAMSSGSGGGGGGGDSALGPANGADGSNGAVNRSTIAGYIIGPNGAYGAGGAHGSPGADATPGTAGAPGAVFPGFARELEILGNFLGCGGGMYGDNSQQGGQGGNGANADSGGTGGGGGGGGGSGGLGGGVIVLLAPSITIGAAANLLANGTDGGPAAAGVDGGNAAGNDGGAGGGGGGEGGCAGCGGLVMLTYETLVNAGTVSVLGGAGGVGALGGNGGLGAGMGTNGGAGKAGADGPAGSAGLLVLSKQA